MGLPGYRICMALRSSFSLLPCPRETWLPELSIERTSSNHADESRRGGEQERRKTFDLARKFHVARRLWIHRTPPIATTRAILYSLNFWSPTPQRSARQTKKGNTRPVKKSLMIHSVMLIARAFVIGISAASTALLAPTHRTHHGVHARRCLHFCHERWNSNQCSSASPCGSPGGCRRCCPQVVQ